MPYSLSSRNRDLPTLAPAAPRGRRARREAGFLLAAFALLVPAFASAAAIAVGGGCSFDDALEAARLDLALGGCPAGSGADDLYLMQDLVLGPDFGSPRRIADTVTIWGNGHQLSSPDDEALVVDPSGVAVVSNVDFVDATDTAVSNEGSLVIRNARFVGNSAGSSTTVRGGAITNVGGTLIIEDSTFLDNEAERTGGAITSTGVLLVRRSVFRGNKIRRDPAASGGVNDGGGAIWASSTTFIHSSWFDQNSVEAGLGAKGGALRLQGAPHLIEHSTFSGNAGGDESGGALYVIFEPASISNSTFSGNHTTGPSGGAVFVLVDTEVAGTIANSTFVDNDADVVSESHGRGISFFANNPGLPLTLKNVVVSGPGTQCTTTEEVTNDGGNFGCLGPAVTDLDPTLADNGGPTPTHALLPTSNAVNAGGAFCGLATDQRWMGRTDACDSGAFEVASCVDDLFEFDGFGTADGNCTSSAIATTSGVRQTRGLCDRDYVRFTASPSSTYVVETTQLTGGADTVLRVEDNCFGSILATDDNSGEGLASRIELSGLDGAVAVRIYDASETYGPAKGYDLGVTCTAGCACSAPDGESLELAGVSVSGPEAYHVCKNLSTAKTVTVAAGGALLLAAGEGVGLSDGFSVEEGGTLIVIADPKFGLDL